MNLKMILAIIALMPFSLGVLYFVLVFLVKEAKNSDYEDKELYYFGGGFMLSLLMALWFVVLWLI